MPETARILPFPRRTAGGAFSSEEALCLAQNYLDNVSEGETGGASDILEYPETAFALLALFKELIEVSPESVLRQSSALYTALRCKADQIWLFDEKDYVLGEFARYAGLGSRGMGRYDDAERWFERAEASYRHTVNPAPLLATLAYAKLAVRYETHRHEDVLDLTPSLIASFQKLGMQAEVSKTTFVQALSLRASNRGEEAFQVLTGLAHKLEKSEDRSLLGQVLVHMGDYCGKGEKFEEACQYYRQALPILTSFGRPATLAELKWSLGSTYRAQGKNVAALEAYRSARAHYQEVGLPVFEAFVGLAIADVLLVLERPREAEWEILSVVPTIESAGLSPEILAATALLSESARQKKANPQALNELRELLANKR